MPEAPLTLADLAARIDAVLARAEQPPARWMTVEAAAAHASLSPESIRRLLANGTLTAHRPVKGRVLVDRHQLDAAIASSTGRVRTGRGLRR